MINFKSILEKQFWVRIWIWCKVNWKFLLGLAIPVLASIILRKGRLSEILLRKQQAKSEHLEAELRAHNLESQAINSAVDEHSRDISAIHRDHSDDLSQINEISERIADGIDSPESATEHLSEKFDLKNLDEEQ